MKKLIVGVDFSESSERAIGVALRLAQGLSGEVVLVHAITAVADQSDPGDTLDAMRPAIEESLRNLCAKHAQPGAKLDWGVVDGDAANELATFAARWGGDAVVVATQGRSGVARMVLGSVAEKLIRQSTVPVIVVGPKAH